MKTVAHQLWRLLVALTLCRQTAPNPVAAPGAVLPPRWARDSARNPCALRGWQLVLWPADGRCYRVFTQGPCPPEQELAVSPRGEPQCRCPPGWLQVPQLSGPTCYPEHRRGPCPSDHYLRPAAAHLDIGECVSGAGCPPEKPVLWPPSGQCYQMQQPPARGPCPWGELLLQDPDNPALAHCGCIPQLPGYHQPSTSCHEVFTRGPCAEGRVLLPGGNCGCHEGLQQYHATVQACYTLGQRGPCEHGEILVAGPLGSSAECRCGAGRVRVHSAAPGCWRPLSRGPCPRGLVVSKDRGVEGKCEPEPCPRGLLLHQHSGTCHLPGAKHPCPKGQKLLFSDTDLGDVSFLGTCKCPTNDRCTADVGEQTKTPAAYKMENSELQTNKSHNNSHHRRGKVWTDILAEQGDQYILWQESRNVTDIAGNTHRILYHHHHKQHYHLPPDRFNHYNRDNENVENEGPSQHEKSERKHYSDENVSQKVTTEYHYDAMKILDDIHAQLALVTEKIPFTSSKSYQNETGKSYNREQILEDIRQHLPTEFLNKNDERKQGEPHKKETEYFDNTHEKARTATGIYDEHKTHKITDLGLGTDISKSKTEKSSRHFVKVTTSQRQTDTSQKQITNLCETVGFAVWSGQCHKLYERGPCQYGAWLVPDTAHRDDRGQFEPIIGRCECRPGYQKSNFRGECRSQLMVISTYLTDLRKVS